MTAQASMRRMCKLPDFCRYFFDSSIPFGSFYSLTGQFQLLLLFPGLGFRLVVLRAAPEVVFPLAAVSVRVGGDGPFLDCKTNAGVGVSRRASMVK